MIASARPTHLMSQASHWPQDRHSPPLELRQHNFSVPLASHESCPAGHCLWVPTAPSEPSRTAAVWNKTGCRADSFHLPRATGALGVCPENCSVGAEPAVSGGICFNKSSRRVVLQKWLLTFYWTSKDHSSWDRELTKLLPPCKRKKVGSGCRNNTYT